MTASTDVKKEVKSKVKVEDMELKDIPLTSLRNYIVYNEKARAKNKELGINRHPVKQCPVELHPTERIRFGRVDQPTNKLLVHLSDEMIHFEKELVPNEVYDLPVYIVHYLSEKGYNQWERKDNADGTIETRVIGKDPRFTLRTIYAG